MLRILVLSFVVVGTYGGGLSVGVGGGYGGALGGLTASQTLGNVYGSGDSLNGGGLTASQTLGNVYGSGDLLNGGGLTGYGNLAASGLTSYGVSNGGLGIGVGQSYSPGHAVSAAIASRRTYEVRPVHLQQDVPIPQLIEVEASEQPVQVIFRSLSSPVHVKQIHTPGARGQVESTHSEDEPHRVVHEVLRPVIQEVREIIQPYRRVVQEVRPVLEEVKTVVAKGEGRLRGYGGGALEIADGGYGGDLVQSVDLGHGGDDLGLALSRGSKGGYKRRAASRKAA